MALFRTGQRADTREALVWMERTECKRCHTDDTARIVVRIEDTGYVDAKALAAKIAELLNASDWGDGDDPRDD